MRRFFCLILITSLLVVSLSSFALAVEEETNQDKTKIAQITLGKVAQRKRSARIASGAITTGLGGVVVLGGFLSDDEDVRLVTSITGGVLAGTGLLTLAIPTKEEQEYKQVQSYSSEQQREVAAQESLAYLSSEARRDRIIGGIVNSGFATYYLYQAAAEELDREANIYSGLVYGGIAAYQFLNESYEEKAYQRVEEAKNNLKVSLVTGEYIGPAVTFSY